MNYGHHKEKLCLKPHAIHLLGTNDHYKLQPSYLGFPTQAVGEDSVGDGRVLLASPRQTLLPVSAIVVLNVIKKFI